MPYDDPDPSDPNMLIGVEIPGDATSDLDMAYAFAEEFAQLGFSEERLRALFRNPHYAGAHRALSVLGEQKIESIIQEAMAAWGGFRVVFRDAPENGGQQQ
jgi:hypothetical protein